MVYLLNILIMVELTQVSVKVVAGPIRPGADGSSSQSLGHGRTELDKLLGTLLVSIYFV